MYMSSCLSKIRSVHTYVIPRTVYFGWICNYQMHCPAQIRFSPPKPNNVASLLIKRTNFFLQYSSVYSLYFSRVISQLKGLRKKKYLLLAAEYVIKAFYSLVQAVAYFTLLVSTRLDWFSCKKYEVGNQSLKDLLPYSKARVV